MFWRGTAEHLSSICKVSFNSKCHKMALVGLEVSLDHHLDPQMTLGCEAWLEQKAGTLRAGSAKQAAVLAWLVINTLFVQ